MLVSIVKYHIPLGSVFWLPRTLLGVSVVLETPSDFSMTVNTLKLFELGLY